MPPTLLPAGGTAAVAPSVHLAVSSSGARSLPFNALIRRVLMVPDAAERSTAPTRQVPGASRLLRIP